MHICLILNKQQLYYITPVLLRASIVKVPNISHFIQSSCWQKFIQHYSAFAETGVTQTMKNSQMTELKQYISAFSDLADQMSGTNEISAYSLWR